MSNLSEEEKEAIEYFKNEILYFKETIVGFEKEIEDKQWLKKQVCELNRDIIMREKLLNYIDKLQKENEKLKKYKNKHSLIKRHYISKDKIRELIKTLKAEGSQTSLYTVSILEELLKGN